MRISDFTNYFLWFFIFNITQHPRRVLTSSYVERCSKQCLKLNGYEILIGPVCSKYYPKFLTCLETQINKSTFAIDKKYYYSVNFTKLKKKTDKFCNKFRKLDFEKDNCDTSNIKVPISSNICVDDHLRLEYLKLDKCPINVRMSWFAYRDSTLRNGCLIIDPWYQVIPRYGPEVVCYKDFIETHGDLRTDNTSLTEIYETFCEQFDYKSVFSCVNRTLKELNPRDFGSREKKEKQECAAKMFVEKRRELCKRLHQVGQKPPGSEKGNILNCKKLVAEPHAWSMETLATKYSKCLRIDSELAKLVYDNLMSHKDIDRCRSNSSYFEYMISTQNGAGFRFPGVEHLLLVFVTLQVVFL